MRIRPRAASGSSQLDETRYLPTVIWLSMRVYMQTTQCVQREMNESDFEGTLVLEKLARLDQVDEFMDAVDSDDVKRAAALMKSASIDAETIALVLKKMADPADRH